MAAAGIGCLRCATAIETELLQMQAETGQDGAKPQTTLMLSLPGIKPSEGGCGPATVFRDEAVLWREVGQRLFTLSKH